nr:acyl-coenzyme A thioesterase 13-like [Ciona intestinalis]|eukprot:XP_002119944.1 acyl-coenzyme A thioesterase 13-like [Ciona intestinalis]
MASLQAVRQIVKSMKHTPIFEKCLQHIHVVSAGDGKIKCTMPVMEEHLNMNKTMHGGLTATLVDSVSSWAFATTKEAKFGVSIDINVTYLTAAKQGETITITSEVLKQGRTIGFANVDIHNEAGNLVATGRHTKFMASAAY